ncbi:MAG: zinc-binding alcohol dehydrogenase [Planctomycetes bacterium]|nr:zinc-binding alcohol dehydrogenase [Planctomycetota bacterium]
MRSDRETHETRSATAYWVVSPGVGELRSERVPSPSPGHSILRTEFSAVSIGTERLVGLGLVPRRSWRTMQCAHMAGSFAFPVKYGYSAVGTIVEGSLAGERVFVMHPHQDIACIDDERATHLPDSIPSPRATLIPNLETALNAYWDSELQKGERSIIVGGGPLGILVAFVLAGHGHRTRVVEIDDARRAFAGSLPWIDEVVASTGVGEHVVAFHTSASASGLQTSIDATGFEGRIVELSWYGDRQVTIDLGGTFHHERKRILASQVASIATPMRGAVSHDQRMRRVLELLDTAELDRLLAPAVSFERLPQSMQGIYAGATVLGVPLVSYRHDEEPS